MIEKIKYLLNKNGIENYRITEKLAEVYELYYIKKQLDIPRIKEMKSYSITVFNDAEADGRKLRGESTALVSVGMSDEEIESRLKSAFLAASFAKNPFYELADPVAEERKLQDTDLAAMSLKDQALGFADAIFSVDTKDDAFINSLEIFAGKNSVHIIASNGLDVSYDSYEIKGEFVSQCVTPLDVEQYRQFAYDSFNTEAVKEKVLEAIDDVRARANASVPPKTGKYTIILKGEHIAELFMLYGARSASQVVFPGYSNWKTGDDVQGETEGERLNLFLEPNAPYSDEGIPMPERQLLKDGSLCLIHGGTRFARYLGIEPVGDYRKLRCTNGSVSLSDMRKPGVLELVSFSDFQMDIMDGHFKGEIRLAHLYNEDGTVTELTGGSVNGSLLDAQKNLVFSLEKYADNAYEGPLAVCIRDVAVAGM